MWRIFYSSNDGSHLKGAQWLRPACIEYEAQFLRDHLYIPAAHFDRIVSESLMEHGIATKPPFTYIRVMNEQKALMFKLKYHKE